MALRLLLASACLACAAPAAGAVTVIGGSSARLCYEAAESPLSPTPETFRLCDEAIAVEPLSEADRTATLVNRGILRVRAGRTVEGLADFDEAIRRDPSLAEAWFNRGVALMRTGAPERALPAFEEAVARGTESPALAYFGRAAAHEALGNLRAAHADYRRASELDPSWERPRAELARFTLRPR